MDTGFTKIEWTGTVTPSGLLPGYTFNPWIGCTNVSPGCDHCYAEARMDTWLGKAKWGPGQERVRTSKHNWGEPERWNKRAEAEGVRRKVFCASLADVFDNEVDPQWRADLFALIDATPHLDWLLLTKRIGNGRAMLDDVSNALALRGTGAPWPPRPNVWLGATVVNQEEADRDITKLLATPAAVRFLSIEPILGEINIEKWLHTGRCRAVGGSGPFRCGLPAEHDGEHSAFIETGATWFDHPPIDWVIVGGESGPKARPTDVAHIRSIVRQCQAAGTRVFVKQLGSQPRHWCKSFLAIDPAERSAFTEDACDNYEAHEQRLPCWKYGRRCVYLEHSKGGHMEEWPEDLRVREFPS